MPGTRLGVGAQAVGTAVAEQLARDREAEPKQEVFDLVMPSIPTRFETGTPEHQAVVDGVRRSFKGRPPGAQNIATRDMLNFVRKMYGDPMESSARWLLHTPETLARELGCTKSEAFDKLERIRIDLRRYLYAPRSPEDGRGEAVPPTFNMVIGGQIVGAGADERPPWAYLDDKKPAPLLEGKKPAGD